MFYNGEIWLVGKFFSLPTYNSATFIRCKRSNLSIYMWQKKMAIFTTAAWRFFCWIVILTNWNLCKAQTLPNHTWLVIHICCSGNQIHVFSGAAIASCFIPIASHRGQDPPLNSTRRGFKPRFMCIGGSRVRGFRICTSKFSTTTTRWR